MLLEQKWKCSATASKYGIAKYAHITWLAEIDNDDLISWFVRMKHYDWFQKKKVAFLIGEICEATRVVAFRFSEIIYATWRCGVL